MTTTPDFYVDGRPYTPGPNEKHLLAATPNGDPTCICGFSAPGATSQMNAVSRIQKHIHGSGIIDPAGNAQEDPWGSPAKPRESAIVTRLRAAREEAWPELRPAFDVAIMQARQAEYEADRASTIAMSGFEAAYSPLVLALAESSVDAQVAPEGRPW